MIKYLKILIFICTLPITTFSQTTEVRKVGNLEAFLDYSGWGFFATPVVYQKPTMVNRIGVEQMFSESKYSFQFGAKRYFSRTFKWSFNTGITFNWIPSPNYKHDIIREIPDGYSYSEFDDPYDGLYGVYVTIPLNMEYKQRLGKHIYINFSAGLHVGFGSSVFVVKNNIIRKKTEEDTKVNVFTIIADQNGFIVGGQLRAGFYVMLDRFLLQTNLVYNKSFSNLWEGEYRFSSLLSSGRTIGTFKQSGDYFGISTTVFLKRKK